jgi:hypothetical protein
MKRIPFLYMISAVLTTLVLNGCHLEQVPFTTARVTIALPGEALQAGKQGYDVVMTNVATGRSQHALTDTAGVASVVVEEGVYNISVTAEKTLTTTIGSGSTQQSYTQTVVVSGLLEKQSVLGNKADLTISLQLGQKGSGFLIQEIYFAGSTTPGNGSYYQDQYIEIYNNSDSVLYADGLSIAESAHLTNTAVAEFTNYPNDFIVQAVYTIPGNGTTYPVQPGQSIVIASLGINHKTANANSPVDLSKADFEWYDGGKDVDVPEVPNMIRNFCYSNTIWVLHTRGYRGYAIFKAPGNYTDFLAQNTVQVLTASGSSVSRVKVANSLILDGVDLGAPGAIGSKSLASSIDLSYSYCTAAYNGKSVRRKVLSWKNGRAILQDTNNSANDFIPDATPSPWKAE